MRRLIRQYASYLLAVIIGFVAVPLLHRFNIWELALLHLQKVIFAGSIGVILVMAWLLRKDYPHRTRWVTAEIVLIVLMMPVAFGSGILVYDASTAWRGESVHWHADFAVVIDGERQDLIDPRNFCDGALCRFTNHTGTGHVHEHGDRRIHIHGPVERPQDATIGVFFGAVGGELTATELRFPTNDGWVNRTDTAEKTVKALVKTGEGPDRTWQLLDHPAQYRISPYTDGPTDTILVVFDAAAADAVLRDVRQDGRYRGTDLP